MPRQGLCWTILFLWAAPGQAADPALAQAEAHFEKEIRPVLEAKCLKCHNGEKQRGSLRLDSREAILQGGDTGPALVPGKPADSLLLQALNYTDFRMPPAGQLPEATIRHFEKWIAEGAHWPEESQIRDGTVITKADRQWWAFRPLVKADPPILKQDSWSRTPIDRFVHARLAEKGLSPAPEADRATLVRRVYFDILGVPPTPEETDAFVNDDAPDAWERLVDRLLDDPRYGEHAARYWLDLVRYCESDGWNQDAYRPHIWRYRDYVIRSFNEDKPYPQFVREQLAGDEIGEDNPEHLAAAGFLRLGIYEYNQRDARGHWNDIMNEMTDVVGDVFLGMSMACARCHNHKFDPILQADYFRLRAFLEPVVWRDDLVYATEEEKAEYRRRLAVWEEKTKDVRARIDALLRPYNDRKWKSTVDKFPLDIQACFHKPVDERTSLEHQLAYLVSRQFLEEGGGPLKSMSKQDQKKYDELQKELSAFDECKPEPLPPVMTATDFAGKSSPTCIPEDREGKPIPPDVLTVLTNLDSPKPLEIPPLPDSTGRRTALARWIGRSDNPLTTRVIVNRVWQQHFGEGIVATPNDFGRMGQAPSHPELLDWLAVNFVENGWSFKKLHRLILTSAVYRQSAFHPRAEECQAIDAAESLLWRAPVRRLRAEQIRDAMLSASGELDPKLGGPSVEEKTPRRGIYVQSYRNRLDTFLHGFDMANGLKSVADRDNTTTATQALMMINGDYSLERAKKFADRLQGEKLPSPGEVVRRAVRLTWGREPTSAELAGSLRFITAAGKETVDRDRLIDFCHVLLNSNEFLYVD